MRALPDVTCVSPTSLGEVTEVTKAITSIPGTCFLRLDKDKGPDGPDDEAFVLGRPRLVRQGRDVALFTTGGILSDVVKGADALESMGVSCSVYAVHTIKPLEPARFLDAVVLHRR